MNELAKNGQLDHESFITCMHSLLQLNANSVEAVYNENIQSLSIGLTTLKQILLRQNRPALFHTISYTITLLHLEKKLSKQPDMLTIISQRIAQTQQQASHLAITHQSIIASFANIYKDTVSKLRPQIRVQGSSHYLTDPIISDQVRALLLAGIRSVILWRQLGGNKWQLLTKKNTYSTLCEVLENIDANEH